MMLIFGLMLLLQTAASAIGSVEVSIICSSNQRSVFCSSEGDQLLYSWTLNGDPLMEGNSSIDLDEGTDGDISCSVKNHVSHAQKTIRLEPCPGLELNCSFNQPDPCYAALGHKLNLLTVRDAREYDLKIIKRINYTQDDPVCRVKYGRMRDCDLYNNRPEVTIINGTVIIKRVIRADSGNYRLTLAHCSDGTETSRDLQVIVEAPIGSVEVSIICSSNQRSVFCSSEGDQLLYSWTLNGDPLMDGNSSIELNEGTDGDISCSVKNHVSHAQKTIRLEPCPGPTTAAVTSTVTSSLTSAVTSSSHTSECVCSVSVVFVLAWGFQLMVLLGLLGGFHIYMRHTSGKKEEDQKVRMSRFRERHEHTAEDS
ncbi:uncharacterized protein [Sinocyclocheilus grahami]|uniref:uncharacterized protein n=1 Tax=Sinocyclocheilus grahami TaxID=75366 RepID=UPI0007AD5E34|nr:PREDICTED: uncharacterized protein LOC107559616 [Sinocyclocheilus grahami]